MPRTGHDPLPQSESAQDDLVPAVARELGSALASLRAALEGIARDFDEADPRQERVRRAVLQTIPIARQVEALADCTDRRPPHALACTLQEIASSVRCALRGAGCATLLLALEDRETRFRVDGPLLVRAIALLGEEIALHGGEVLLRARLEDGDPSFSLVWPAQGEEPEALALQRRLLEHEARRLGARFEGTTPQGGCARIAVRFPASTREGALR